MRSPAWSSGEYVISEIDSCIHPVYQTEFYWNDLETGIALLKLAFYTSYCSLTISNKLTLINLWKKSKVVFQNSYIDRARYRLRSGYTIIISREPKQRHTVQKVYNRKMYSYLDLCVAFFSQLKSKNSIGLYNPKFSLTLFR